MKKIKYIVGIVIIFLIDQISKIIIMNNFSLNESKTVIGNFFKLTYTHNKGAAFGIFSGKIIFILIVSFFVLCYLLFELFRKKKSNLCLDIGLILIIGGLIGNLVDRIYFGYVRDFLDFNLFGYDMAIFNIGDTVIVIGVFLFMISTLLEVRSGKSN